MKGSQNLEKTCDVLEQKMKLMESELEEMRRYNNRSLISAYYK